MTRLPDEAWADEQIQAGLVYLSAESAKAWEASRPAREAKARHMMTEWLWHADCCEKRADEYLSDAARFPAAHKDHLYYLRLANEQLVKAADARRYAEIQRKSL